MSFGAQEHFSGLRTIIFAALCTQRRHTTNMVCEIKSLLARQDRDGMVIDVRLCLVIAACP